MQNAHFYTSFLLQIISMSRYVFLLVIMGLLSKSNIPLILILISLALSAHLLVKPYFGLGFFHIKKLLNESEFVPFKRWMVAQSSAEISGEKYKRLFEDENLSPKGKEILFNTYKNSGKITRYDVANIYLFEDQIGRHEYLKLEDDQLKHAIKDKLSNRQ